MLLHGKKYMAYEHFQMTTRELHAPKRIQAT